jgi:hypothetical protein
MIILQNKEIKCPLLDEECDSKFCNGSAYNWIECNCGEYVLWDKKYEKQSSWEDWMEEIRNERARSWKCR